MKNIQLERRMARDDGDGRFALSGVEKTKTNIEGGYKISTGLYSANQGVDADKARAQPQISEGMLKFGQMDQIGSALDKRYQLRKRSLATDQIYSVIKDYIGLVRKAMDDLLILYFPKHE